MPRRRRVLSIALLLALLGAGGGYWLAHRDGSIPVLRSAELAIPAVLGDRADEGSGTLFARDGRGGTGALVRIDTRSGAVRAAGFEPYTGMPAVVPGSGHAFDPAAPGVLALLDMRTGATLRAIRQPTAQGLVYGVVDERAGRLYQAFDALPVLQALDARTGDLMGTARTCLAAGGLGISHAAGRVFEPCSDGTLVVLDARNLRHVRTINLAGLGSCGCGVFVDDRTGRIFLAASDSLGVLDARTGALLATVPAQTSSPQSVLVDQRSGEVLVAPYLPVGAGSPAREVLALDGRTGAVRRRYPVPENPTALLLNPRTGHLLVTSAGPLDQFGAPAGQGSLSVLDRASGAILRSIGVGVLPGDLAADARAGHLFVLNRETAFDGELLQPRPDGWWPRTLRRIKGWAGWLPFAAPARPRPPTNATLMMLDLAAL